MNAAAAALVAAVFQANPSCGPALYANDLIPFALRGITITKELAIKDIASFCRATTRNQAEHDIAFESPAAGDVANDDDIKSEARVASWLRAYFPDLEVRLDAFRKGQVLAPLGLGTFDKARAYLKSPDPKLTRKGIYSISNPPRIDYSDHIPKGLEKKLAFAAACEQLVFGFECPGALDEVIERSMPVEAASYDITHPRLYREFLSDPSYGAGLQRAALKMLDHAEKGDAGGADLFSDVKSSFLEAGVAPEKAENMTWKVMALLATGGANTGARLMLMKSEPEIFPQKVAIGLIGELAPALDSMSMASGHPYSYPKGVRSTCDTGKPYHFWLTAYLARELAREGTSPKAAAAAAFLGEKGYQMMSDTGTRHPSQPFEEDFLSPYSNSLRMDLAVASAGAVYGAATGAGAAAPKLDIDIDEGVRRVVLASHPVSRLDSKAAEKLYNDSPLQFALRWSWLMGPDAAFKLYEPALQ